MPCPICQGGYGGFHEPWCHHYRHIFKQLDTKTLEPLVTKAKQAYIDAVMKDNYTGFEEHFIAEYLAKAFDVE